jgi:exopolysaccharide biosynthesis polyprenyl glycosylphosphotransferase
VTTQSDRSVPFPGDDKATRLRAIRLPLRLSERRILLFAGDTLALVLALAAGVALWTLARPAFVRPYPEQLVQYGGWLLALPTVWLLLMASTGAYDLKAAANFLGSAKRVATVFGVLAIGYLAFFFISANENSYYSFPLLGETRALRILPAVFAVSATAIELIWRWAYATQLTKGQFQRRLLVVGAGEAGCTFLDFYNTENLSSSLQIVGVIDDSPAKQGAQIAGFPVLGNNRSLVDIVSREHVDEIVLSISRDLNGDMFQAIMDCFELGVQITPMPVMYEALTGRVPVEHIGQNWYVSLAVGAAPPGRFYDVAIRMGDVLFGLSGLIGLGVLIPLVWLGNRFWSPGPLFYSQLRVGRGGKTYKIYKFRTMVPDAEKLTGAVWAKDRDPRITRFGNMLRKSRLDELPQFWNILHGEMGLVGPRPERPEFVDKLAEQIPFYRSRHAVKPGLTGWAQVRYRYGSSVEDALIKLQYDLYYIKYQSFWLNTLILYKTVRVVVGLKGR